MPSNPTISATRLLHFDAAHRVMEHESKCKNLHGHRYVVEATFDASKLDKLGRVIDFGVITTLLGGWIDAHWDHNTILFDADKALGHVIEEQTGQSVFYLPYNPTAENIAHYLMTQVCPDIFKDYEAVCRNIIVHETPNCYATISR